MGLRAHRGRLTSEPWGTEGRGCTPDVGQGHVGGHCWRCHLWVVCSREPPREPPVGCPSADPCRQGQGAFRAPGHTWAWRKTWMGKVPGSHVTICAKTELHRLLSVLSDVVHLTSWCVCWRLISSTKLDVSPELPYLKKEEYRDKSRRPVTSISPAPVTLLHAWETLSKYAANEWRFLFNKHFTFSHLLSVRHTCPHADGNETSLWRTIGEIHQSLNVCNLSSSNFTCRDKAVSLFRNKRTRV